ncbi:11212_t:CDS:2, partial [Cetraspora pellucida]
KSKKCKGSAIMVLIKNLYYLQDLVQHNHLPDATRPEDVKAVTELKKRASETREKPIQLIQNYSISDDIQPFMPSLNALRQIVSHSKKIEKIPQTQNVLEINIPPLLCVTLNSDPFLIQDLIVDQSRILIFSTNENIKRLSEAPYWIMDGTFKTVPDVFYQLYTIHALVAPKWIITNFERAAINASRCEFPHAIKKWQKSSIVLSKNADGCIERWDFRGLTISENKEGIGIGMILSWTLTIGTIIRRTVKNIDNSK